MQEPPDTAPPPARPPLSCLVVEDDRADFVLTRRVIDQADVPCDLGWVPDGQALLETLDTTPIPPDLIVLDLNLPRLDGRATLSRLRTHPRWRAIPVIVLTTSSDQEDVCFCYRAGANCYLVKSADYARFKEDMAYLLAFWGRSARLPNSRCTGAGR